MSFELEFELKSSNEDLFDDKFDEEDILLEVETKDEFL